MPAQVQVAACQAPHRISWNESLAKQSQERTLTGDREEFILVAKPPRRYVPDSSEFGASLQLASSST